MPKKSKDDREEYKRFLETAKKVEADERPESFERAFRKVATPKKSKNKSQ